MRKVIFTLGCFMGTMIAQAQIEKKDVLLGGSFGFGGSSQGNTIGSGSNSNLQPFIQFAYKQNRTIGFGIDMYQFSNRANNGTNKQSSFSISPSVNFNQYHPLKGNFGWVLQEYVGATFFSSKNSNGSTTVRSNSTGVVAGIIPGLYYMAGEKKNWLLQANVGGLGASYSKFNNTDHSSLNFNANLFQSYRFGFAYVFRK